MKRQCSISSWCTAAKQPCQEAVASDPAADGNGSDNGHLIVSNRSDNSHGLSDMDADSSRSSSSGTTSSEDLSTSDKDTTATSSTSEAAGLDKSDSNWIRDSERSIKKIGVNFSRRKMVEKVKEGL